ncbi:hypothetical protein [Ancylobacter oerskovii]|uniref:Transposase n=1 Tax=Ancylobacter oerskovii TaxID=459519 RepID=A0ABW4Z2Y2_9HYPH|nr:hypothetical protein [Ancylobacter oerskovii]MBS7545486.1 hypothetical protein [Ancylobacter oerskovii]
MRLGSLTALAPKELVLRYQRERPGELLHLDIKKLARFTGIGHRITGNRRGASEGIGYDFLHLAIDDATRLAYIEVLCLTSDAGRRHASWCGRCAGSGCVASGLSGR